MKRRSAKRAADRQLEELIYFSDRDLGKRFPTLLKEGGVKIVGYSDPEAFPANAKVSDPDWISYACSKGWVCLTHDKAMRREEGTLDEVFRDWKPCGVLFTIKGGASTHQLAELVLEQIAAIDRLVRKYRRKNEAFIGTIRRKFKKGGIAVPVVERWANQREWEEKKLRRLR